MTFYVKEKQSQIFAKTYPNYDYWEIYWQVNDSSFLGRKRTISNRLKKMVTTTNKAGP